MLRRLSSTGLRSSLLLAVMAMPWLGCGSNVVVDSGQSGMGGGAGGTGTAGGGRACSAPALVGDLDTCAVDPDPGGGHCGDATVCDSGGNQWQAKCNGQGCECRFNGREICACAFDADPCESAVPDDCCALLNASGCCPYPWLKHPGCKATGEPCTLNADCCNYLCFDGTCRP